MKDLFLNPYAIISGSMRLGDDMLHMDEDDFLVGTPQSKFFDVMFHANRTIVEDALLNCVERHVAMESILEELASKYDIDLEQEIMNFKYEKQDEMHHRKMDFLYQLLVMF